MDEILNQIHYYAQQLKGINMWQAACDYDYISSFLDSPRWNDGKYYGVVPRGEETVDEYSHNCPIPFTASRCLVSRCCDNDKALEVLNRLSEIFNTLKSDVSGDGLTAINAYIENTNLYIELLGGEPVPPGPVKEPILYRFFNNKPPEYIYGDVLITTLDKAKPIDHGEAHVLDVSPSVLSKGKPIDHGEAHVLDVSPSVLSKGKPIDHGELEVITPEIMPMMAALMIDHGSVSVLDVELDRIVEPTAVEQCCYGIMSTDSVSTDITPFDESEFTLMESTSIQQSYGEFIDDAVPLFIITHNDIMETDSIQQSYGEFTDDGMLSFVIMQNDIMETWEPPALPTVSSEMAIMHNHPVTISAGQTNSDFYYSSTMQPVVYDSTKSYAARRAKDAVPGGNDINPTFFALVDSSGELAVKNISSSSVTVEFINVSVCSSSSATVITVYDSSNNPYNAFQYTSDGIDYYYVLDGTQTDWTDDLASIGYSLQQIYTGWCESDHSNMNFSLWNECNLLDDSGNQITWASGMGNPTIYKLYNSNGDEVSASFTIQWNDQYHTGTYKLMIKCYDRNSPSIAKVDYKLG